MNTILFSFLYTGVLVVPSGSKRSPAPPSRQEDDPSIVDALNKTLPKGWGALCFIGTYAPEKISPSKAILAEIGLLDELAVEDALEALCNAGTRNLAFLVNSFGGGVSSSFKIAWSVRKSFDRITVFVPHIAASGGTLLALTGNDIVMGPMSNLSPIDTQLIRNGEQFSANAMVRSFHALNNLFKQVAEEDAPYPWKAMADQLDPVEFQQWVDAAALMQSHAETILERNPSFRVDAKKIIHALTEHFPTHDYTITFDEACKFLGKDHIVASSTGNVKPLWDAMRGWFRHYVMETSGTHVVKYYLPVREKSNGAKKGT